MNTIIMIFSFVSFANIIATILKEKLYSFNAYVEKARNSINKIKESYEKLDQIETTNSDLSFNKNGAIHAICATMMILKVAITIVIACHFSKWYFWLLSCGKLIECINLYRADTKAASHDVNSTLVFTEKEIKTKAIKNMVEKLYNIIYWLVCFVLTLL